MLKDKVYLITGASGGVAKSIIKKFANVGANLVLADRNGSRERNPSTIIADLSSHDGAKELVQQIIQKYGKIDGIIHTIGGFSVQSIFEYNPSTYDQMLDTNLRTTVHIAAAATPELEKTQGFFGAIAAGQVIRGGAANLALYSAAKGAMVLFLKSLALEMKAVRYGIVYPMGAIDTPNNRRDMPDVDTSTWIDPNEIAEAFAYMATRSHGGRVQEIQVFPN